MIQEQKLIQTMNIEYKAQSTKDTYQFHINNFKIYCNGDENQNKILEYLDFLVTNKKYKPSSLHSAKYSLIYYFTNILHQKITIYIPKIKQERRLPKIVNKDVIFNMIEITGNLKHKIIIELLYSSGIRLGEIINLKWQDINFNDKLIRINLGKGRKDRYSILSQRVVENLLKYKEDRIDNNDYIFINSFNTEKKLCDKTIGAVLKNACKKLGLSYHVTPHQLRHTLATHLVENDVNLRKIQALLGHSNLNTTKIYTQVAKNDLINIKNPLDDLYKSV